MSGTTGFIYGKFRNFVDKQIEKRNEIFSKQERSPQDILLLTGKTSWVKMTSAVNFTSESFLGKNYNLYGDSLARQYQLFAGTLYNSASEETSSVNILRSRFALSPDNVTKGALSSTNYGLGGIREYGYRPMPGIENVSVISKNQFGSLREATVNFKCYNTDQLSILESLYMRPGYQVLLEWGHTIYYDNDSNFTTGKSIPTIDFFKKGSSIRKVLEQIEKLKYKSGGNYDAILGIVKNFSFVANPDGSYSCTTNLITWGEIVESLKMSNAPLQTSFPSDNWIFSGSSANAKKTSLENYLNKIQASLGASGYPTPWAPTDRADVEAIQKGQKGSNSYYELSPDNEIGNFNASEKTYLSSLLKNGWENKPYGFKIKQSNGTFLDQTEGYIQLGHLCYIINILNGIYQSDGKNILPINYSFEHNKALTSPYQFSVDPRVCFYFTETNSGFDRGPRLTNSDSKGTYYEDVENTNPRSTANNRVMYFMGLLININYIINTLNSCVESSTGEILLLPFLKKLMEGINLAMGSYNKWDVVVENHTVKIVDTQYIPLKSYPKAKSKIILSNSNDPTLKNKNFGFCQAYNFASRITNKLTATIAISAQANAQALNLDNVSFSRLNKGMKDRINPFIMDSHQRGTGTSVSSKEDEAPENTAKQALDFLSSHHLTLSSRNPAVEPSDVDTARNYLKDVLNRHKLKVESGGTPFLPIDLNLTVDGISGIRIGECFFIETEKLPYNYRWKNGEPKIKFLVRKIDHSVSDNRWVTNISALSVLNPYDPNIPERMDVGNTQGLNTASSTGTTSITLDDSEIDTGIKSNSGASGGSRSTNPNENVYEITNDYPSSPDFVFVNPVESISSSSPIPPFDQTLSSVQNAIAVAEDAAKAVAESLAKKDIQRQLSSLEPGYKSRGYNTFQVTREHFLFKTIQLSDGQWSATLTYDVDFRFAPL